ncbi:hypothetical protein SDC9_173686 [bioreactor metagenome]|uniref:Uncharacterized protein n=1 Tax=bioreactor metagenome TaxID=1076179 RepID=A0A645GK76_9ZZZZ
MVNPGTGGDFFRIAKIVAADVGDPGSRDIHGIGVFFGKIIQNAGKRTAPRHIFRIVTVEDGAPAVGVTVAFGKADDAEPDMVGIGDQGTEWIHDRGAFVAVSWARRPGGMPKRRR